MNKKQIAYSIIGGASVILIIIEFCSPGWYASKIVGIISMTLTFTGMLLSYLSEEKKKKDSDRSNS